MLQGHTLLGRIAGADAQALTRAIAEHVGRQAAVAPLSYTDLSPAPVPEESPDELDTRLRKLMSQSRVVLFMKGVPDAPRCGFSRKTVAVLREQKVEFTYFDILSDESVREGALDFDYSFPHLFLGCGRLMSYV